jgi:oligopeptide transport system ATP-binding protein
MAQRVIVMYGGYFIEEAQVKELYANPQHPYTMGLLGSLPRLDLDQKKRLVSIDGLPPTLMEKPQYCPFAPRCKFAIERCWNENPVLETLAPDHRVACWVDIKTGRAR